jgi:hypothetical protein
MGAKLFIQFEMPAFPEKMNVKIVHKGVWIYRLHRAILYFFSVLFLFIVHKVSSFIVRSWVHHYILFPIIYFVE